MLIKVNGNKRYVELCLILINPCRESLSKGEIKLEEREIYIGIVTAVHRERYEVFVNEKNIFARLKPSVYYIDNFNDNMPTVGDNVEVCYNPIGDSIIVNTKKRASVFSRQDPDAGRCKQNIAANFDYVFIMMSLNYDFNIKRLERYLTAAWQSGGTPVVILTKADIAEDLEKKLAAVGEIAIGVDVCAISSVTGNGIERLYKYVKPDKTIIFLGSSGVGKSTLINVFTGEEVMKTGGIRETDSKGHHTTTYRQMIILNNGAKIIDTPGMRELGMLSVENGMEQSFSYIYELIKKCKYSNCSHTSEEGCAIVEALKNGYLPRNRWNNFLKLQRESKFQEEKERRSKTRIVKGTKNSYSKKDRRSGNILEY